MPVNGITSKRPQTPDETLDIALPGSNEDNLRLQVDKPNSHFCFDNQSSIDSEVASSLSDLKSESEDNDGTH
jgi:hypothetical protein